MLPHARLQTIGPATLFGALLAAEVAAGMLNVYPSSPILWSLNLQLFGIFQRSHYLLSSHIDIPYFQLVFIGLPLFVTACCGLLFRRRLALATASSLAFIYVCFLLCAWYLYDPAWQQGAVFTTGVAAGPGLYLTGIMFAAALLSFLVSHISYLRACRADRDGLQLASFADRPGDNRGAPVLRGT
jgi:hypothetical protein